MKKLLVLTLFFSSNYGMQFHSTQYCANMGAGIIQKFLGGKKNQTLGENGIELDPEQEKINCDKQTRWFLFKTASGVAAIYLYDYALKHYYPFGQEGYLREAAGFLPAPFVIKWLCGYTALLNRYNEIASMKCANRHEDVE